MLGVVHSFFHYTLVYARLPPLLLAGLLGSLAQLLGVLVKQEVIGFTDAQERLAAVSQLANPAVLIALGHLFGVLSYLTHKMTLQQHLVLHLRQQQLLGYIREETEQCETLLRNILPPHLIGTLAGMVELNAKRTASHSEGASMLDNHNLALLAQQYTECTFLFAKIGGLNSLVNDESRDPKQVMRVLQRMFDTFDRLCDIYKVQKVRRVANEPHPNPKSNPNE